MAKVSVIIPVYNVEKYLRECLDSVVNQTLKDIEIICVDDGSTDDSGAILDEYAAKDSRIKVIHKENGGYGKAMNVGIDSATGEYIGIVEPDDYVELNMFENFYKIVSENNLDFVKGYYYNYSSFPLEKNELVANYDNNICNRKLKPIEYFETFKGGASIWSAIYNREFLIEKDIKFLETPGASFQDTSFWIKVLLSAERGMFVNEAYNHYRIDNENSSVKSNSKIFCICDEMHELDRIYASSKKIVKIINSLKIDKYAWNYNRLTKQGQKQFKDIYLKEIDPIIKLKNYIPIIVPARSIKTFNDVKYQNIKRIFSVQNVGIHKVLCIFGLKFQFKSKKLIERERFNKLEGRVNYLASELKRLKKAVKGKI